MGFFNNFRNIGKINTLLKQIEPKVDAIYYETNSPYPNVSRIKMEAATIAVLMNFFPWKEGQPGADFRSTCPFSRNGTKSLSRITHFVYSSSMMSTKSFIILFLLTNDALGTSASKTNKNYDI